jgi:hypothetical protein
LSSQGAVPVRDIYSGFAGSARGNIPLIIVFVLLDGFAVDQCSLRRLVQKSNNSALLAEKSSFF